VTGQSTKGEQGWITDLISGTEGSIQNWIAPLGWGRSWPNRAEGQHRCCLVKTIALTTLQSYRTSQLQLILWTEVTKYYSQASHLVKWHQSFYLYANTKIGHLRNNFTICQKTEISVVPEPGVFYCLFFFSFSSFIFIIPVLTSLSLFFNHYSYPLHFPSFCCATIHGSPSQLFFLPPLIHSFPHLHLPLLPSHNHTTLPSYTLTTCWLPTVYNPSPLQSLTQAPSTTRTEIHPNIHKGHKTQHFPDWSSTLPTKPF
jgi:hypothetical protein